MIYFIGNKKHVNQVAHLLPQAVVNELLTSTLALDRAYGEHRNFLESGGYSIIVDDVNDFLSLSSIVPIRHHPAEWATKIEDYVISFYLFNNDFSIALFTPYDITPDIILEELEIEEEY